MYPNPLEAGVERVLTPFNDFIRDQTTGSVLLIVSTVIALIIANSPLAQDYENFLAMHARICLGDWTLKMSVQHWINDGLMSLFFFVLGLEIKREILVGELKNPQQSLPVIAAALGGMLVPAGIFICSMPTRRVLMAGESRWQRILLLQLASGFTGSADSTCLAHFSHRTGDH